MLYRLVLTYPRTCGGEAVLSANHILHKISHKKRDETPYELSKERKPSYKYLKLWGRLAKVEVPMPKQVKIGPKTVDCIFIGYAYNSSTRGFLVHKLAIPDINEGMIIKLRNVVFFENIFPYKERKEESSHKKTYEVVNEIPENNEESTHSKKKHCPCSVVPPAR